MFKKLLLLFVLSLAFGTKAQNVSIEPKLGDKQSLWGYVNSSTGKWVVKPAFHVAEPFKIGSDGKMKALVTKGNLQGYIGPDGKPLGAGIVFESMEPLIPGENQIVTVKGKKGVLSPEGKYIIQPLYDNIKTSEDDVFIVYKGGKVGILSRQGEMMLEPAKYNDVTRFGNYWKIKKGDKVGLFDPANHMVVVSADFTEVLEPFDFPGGTIFPVKKKNGKWGAVDSSGKEKISCKNQALTLIPSINAIRVFRHNVGDRLFLPNQNLFLELKSWHEESVGPFRQINLEVDKPSESTPDDKILGLSFAEHLNYDRNYKERLDAYNNLGASKSFQIVMDKGGNFLGKDVKINTLGIHWVLISSVHPWNVYDVNGKLVLETNLSGPEFTSSNTWISDGKYILFSDLKAYPIKEMGSNLKFLEKDNNGFWIPMVNNIPDFNSAAFEEVEEIAPNLARVKRAGKWGLFSEKQVLPCLYESLRIINRNGWIEVKSNDCVGLYDPYAKRWILSPENKIKSYEFYSSYSNSPILIYNGKWGLANNIGQITMPMTFTKEVVLKSLTPEAPKSPKINQPKQKTQQPVKEKKTQSTQFQESKEKRRF